MPRAFRRRESDSPTEVIPPPTQPPRDAIEWLAWLMDNAIKIPGTDITVGLDAILGLFPGLGDVGTGLIQAGIVIAAMRRYNLPKPIAARMVANVLMDVGIGAIPIVGDVFDVFFKANTRNIKLLREVRGEIAAGKPMPTKASERYLIGLGLAMGVALTIVLGGTIAGLVWLFRQHPIW